MSHEPTQLERRVLALEEELRQARRQLRQAQADTNKSANRDNVCEDDTDVDMSPVPDTPRDIDRVDVSHIDGHLSSKHANHFLLLLADSALPLGSFAFSSGLESYLAHQRPDPALNSHSQSSASTSGKITVNVPPTTLFAHFLPISISSFSASTLPYCLASYRDPQQLVALDDLFDATILCTVGRRASTAQGRALLSIWERSFSAAWLGGQSESLRHYSSLLKRSPGVSSTTTSSSPYSIDPTLFVNQETVYGHLAPLWGALCQHIGLTIHQTAYLLLLGHVKALVSAAVRANVFGPYQAQKLLATPHVQHLLDAAIRRDGAPDVDVWDGEATGQRAPVLDVWMGRHELLYSRIFNS